MERFVRRKLKRVLGRLFQDFDASKFSLSFLNGQSALKNLSLRPEVARRVLGLQHIEVERALISTLRIKASLTALTTEPIQITVDRISLSLRERTPEYWQSAAAAANNGQNENENEQNDDDDDDDDDKNEDDDDAQQAKYELKDKVIDGLHIRVDEVHVQCVLLPVGGGQVVPPKLVLEVSGLSLYTTNADWQVVELRNVRQFNKGREQRYVFKVLKIRSVNASLVTRGGDRWLPLLPKSTEVHARLVIKKSRDNRLEAVEFNIHVPVWQQPATIEHGVQLALFARAARQLAQRRDVGAKALAPAKRSKAKRKKKSKKKPVRFMFNLLVNEMIFDLWLDSALLEKRRAVAASSIAASDELLLQPFRLSIDDFQVRLMLGTDASPSDKVAQLIMTSLRFDDPNNVTERVLAEARASEVREQREQRARRRRFQYRKRRFNLKPGAFSRWIVAPDIDVGAIGHSKADQLMAVTGKRDDASGIDAEARSHALRKQRWQLPRRAFGVAYPSSLHPLTNDSSARPPLLYVSALLSSPTGASSARSATNDAPPPPPPPPLIRINALLNPIRVSVTTLSVDRLGQWLANIDEALHADEQTQQLNFRTAAQQLASSSSSAAPSSSKRKSKKNKKKRKKKAKTTNQKHVPFWRKKTIECNLVVPSFAFSIHSVTDTPTVLVFKLENLNARASSSGLAQHVPLCQMVPNERFFAAASPSSLALDNDRYELSVSFKFCVDVCSTSPLGDDGDGSCVLDVPQVSCTLRIDALRRRLVELHVPLVAVTLLDHQYFALGSVADEVMHCLGVLHSDTKSRQSAKRKQVAAASNGEARLLPARKVKKRQRRQKKLTKRELKYRRRRSKTAMQRDDDDDDDDDDNGQDDHADDDENDDNRFDMITMRMDRLKMLIAPTFDNTSRNAPGPLIQLDIQLVEAALRQFHGAAATHRHTVEFLLHSLTVYSPSTTGTATQLISTTELSEHPFVCVHFGVPSDSHVAKTLRSRISGLSCECHLSLLARSMFFFFEPLASSSSSSSAKSAVDGDDDKSEQSSLSSSPAPPIDRDAFVQLQREQARPGISFQVDLDACSLVVYNVNLESLLSKTSPSASASLSDDEQKCMRISFDSVRLRKSVVQDSGYWRNMMIDVRVKALSSTVRRRESKREKVVCEPFDIETRVALRRKDASVPGTWRASLKLASIEFKLSKAQLRLLTELSKQVYAFKKLLRQLFRPPKPTWMMFHDSRDRMNRALVDIDSCIEQSQAHLQSASSLKSERTQHRLELKSRFKRLDHIRQPEKRGALMLKKDHHNAAWLRVHAVLKESHLQWYASQSSSSSSSSQSSSSSSMSASLETGEPLGRVSLETHAMVDMVHDQITSQPNCFQISTANDERYFFSAGDNEQDMMDWVNSLLKVQTMIFEVEAIERETDQVDNLTEHDMDVVFGQLEHCLGVISARTISLHDRLASFEGANSTLKARVAELRAELLHSGGERAKLHQQLAASATALRAERAAGRQLRAELEQLRAAAPSSSTLAVSSSSSSSSLSSSASPIVDKKARRRRKKLQRKEEKLEKKTIRKAIGAFVND
jgi:VPS13-like, N-terminal/PH domain